MKEHEHQQLKKHEETIWKQKEDSLLKINKYNIEKVRRVANRENRGGLKKKSWDHESDTS